MNKIALVFPGQGSQQINMGKDFYENSRSYQNVNDLLFGYKPNLKDIIKDERINETQNCQLILYANQLGIYQHIVDNFKLNYQATAGFSLGEYSAYTIADLFSFQDGLQIVEIRSLLMANVISDKVMKVLIGLTFTELQNVVKIIADKHNIELIISNHNTEKQIVVVATENEFKEIESTLKQHGVKRIVGLNTSGPFHTKVYNDASTLYGRYLEQVNINSSNTCDIYLNVTANKYNRSIDFPGIMTKHMTLPVKWYETIINMIADGIDCFVEIGSKSVLASMIKKIDRNVTVITIEKYEDINKLEAVWDRK